ncbi:hypothetical protein ABKY47_002090 [Aeromonas hydrophila]
MRTLKIALTPMMRVHIAHAETLEIDFPDEVELAHVASHGLVRYCIECGSVGEVPKLALPCCQDNNKAFYVPAELAEQARTGFKLTLPRPADTVWSDAEEPEPTPDSYRELQAQHDALQTKFHIALEALKQIGKYPSSRDEELGYEGCRIVARQAIKGVE